MAAMLSLLPSFSSFSTKPNFSGHLKFPPVSSFRVSMVTSRRVGENVSAMVRSSTLVAKVAEKESTNGEPSFEDPRWVGGTWDLKQFKKNGMTDWDAVIDAEVKRRKYLEDNPESSSNDNPVVFDTSVIPWWSWMKRFHLPEAELQSGHAAMIGFFMAYLVDGLTGVGLVDQMGNFFCKLLLFVAVVGVLLVQKNEDIEILKSFVKESTFYDKQWQAAWQDDMPIDSNNKFLVSSASITSNLIEAEEKWQTCLAAKISRS